MCTSPTCTTSARARSGRPLAARAPVWTAHRSASSVRRSRSRSSASRPRSRRSSRSTRPRSRVSRIACSGWNYASWKEPFYGGRPAREWLALYARRFDTVEVNNTFYRLPKKESVAVWERTAPDGFCFAVKVSRYITHIKRLRDLGQPVARFRACIEPLRKLGPFLWPLPPNFPRDEDRLRATLESLPSGERHAFEFRHETWFTEDVYALLRE